YISVFYFLTVLYTNKEYPGPYFEIEKGLFLLFHLVSGILATSDTIALDGGYTLFIFQFIENANKIGFEFNNNNLVYPIRKNINDNLSITEDHFNKTFGSFRSIIETQFLTIGGKFKRFNNSKTITKITKADHYNLQFKVACLLKNIHHFKELLNIPIYPHHKLWVNNNFEFPIDRKLLDMVVGNEIENKKKLDEMIELK
ncbi:hypothetical protein BDC45DRAFT_422432, partial [Circinella umbellata]